MRIITLIFVFISQCLSAQDSSGIWNDAEKRFCEKLIIEQLENYSATYTYIKEADKLPAFGEQARQNAEKLEMIKNTIPIQIKNELAALLAKFNLASKEEQKVLNDYIHRLLFQFFNTNGFASGSHICKGKVIRGDSPLTQNINLLPVLNEAHTTFEHELIYNTQSRKLYTCNTSPYYVEGPVPAADYIFGHLPVIENGHLMLYAYGMHSKSHLVSLDSIDLLEGGHDPFDFQKSLTSKHTEDFEGNLAHQKKLDEFMLRLDFSRYPLANQCGTFYVSGEFSKFSDYHTTSTAINQSIAAQNINDEHITLESSIQH